MRVLKPVFVTVVCAFVIAAAAHTQQKQSSDSEYIAQALSAAPEAVGKGATVVRMQADGSMRTLREGKNEFTCMIMGTDKMCNDPNSMEFINAVMKHTPPLDKVGISYMFAVTMELATPAHTLWAKRQTIIGLLLARILWFSVPKQGIGLHGGYGP